MAVESKENSAAWNCPSKSQQCVNDLQKMILPCAQSQPAHHGAVQLDRGRWIAASGAGLVNIVDSIDNRIEKLYSRLQGITDNPSVEQHPLK